LLLGRPLPEDVLREGVEAADLSPQRPTLDVAARDAAAAR
jgi:hypothetical protein